MIETSGSAEAAAQEAYLPLLDLCEAGYEDLGMTVDPTERAGLLEALAENTAASGELYAAAFGPVDGQHAVDQALSMKMDARLAKLLADVERARGDGRVRVRSGWSEVESRAGDLLDALADAALADHVRRAEVYADLFRGVRDVLAGPTAGEVLQRLEQSHLDLADREAADRVA